MERLPRVTSYHAVLKHIPAYRWISIIIMSQYLMRHLDIQFPMPFIFLVIMLIWMMLLHIGEYRVSLCLSTSWDILIFSFPCPSYSWLSCWFGWCSCISVNINYHFVSVLDETSWYSVSHALHIPGHHTVLQNNPAYCWISIIILSQYLMRHHDIQFPMPLIFPVFILFWRIFQYLGEYICLNMFWDI